MAKIFAHKDVISHAVRFAQFMELSKTNFFGDIVVSRRDKSYAVLQLSIHIGQKAIFYTTLVSIGRLKKLNL